MILIIIQGAPYGSERTYNGLRTALALLRNKKNAQINVFLFADAVAAVLPDQNTTPGFYNIERMIKYIINKGGQVSYCRECAAFRGLENLNLMEGSRAGDMDMLAEWIGEADQVLTF